MTVDETDQHGRGERLERLRAAMHVAHVLRDEAGLRFVVAPLPAADTSLLHTVEPRFAVSVFPFVDGRRCGEAEPASSPDRRSVTEVLARLHAATPAAAQFAGTDDLQIQARAHLEKALQRLNEPWTGGPLAESARGLLADRASDLILLLEEYDRLVGVTRARDQSWVVTHGEPKADNFLATDAGPMLVDWDTALLAPAARDLWWLGTDEGQLATDTEITGRDVAEDDLTLYRLRWDLTDIALYAEWFMAPHARTPETEIAWRALTDTLQLERRWPGLV